MSVKLFAQNIIKYRLYIILFIFALTIGLANIAKDIKFESNYRIWFEKESKDLQNYDNFIAQFGSDSSIVIIFSDNDLFTQNNINMINTISTKLINIEGIKSVNSLTTYTNTNPTTKQEIKLFKEQLKNDHNIIGSLLSKNLSTTMIVAKLNKKSTIDPKYASKLQAKLKDILLPFENNSGIKFYINGQSYIDNAFVELAKKDSVVFVAMAVIGVFIFLYFMFRSWIGSLIPLLVVIITFIIVLASQVLLGYNLNNFTANLPIFVVAIAIVHAIHIYWVWSLEIKEGLHSKDAAIFSIQKNFLPIVLTSVTTAIGFATLGVSDIVPIKTLGFSIAFSAIIAFILSLTFLPALLSYFCPKTDKQSVVVIINPATYSRFIINHDKKIIIVSAILFVIFSIGVSKVIIDNNPITFFDKNHEVRKSVDYITNNITGPMQFELVIDSKESNGIKNIEFLKEVNKFENELFKEFHDIRHSYSLINIYKQLNKLKHNNKDEFYKLPLTSNDINSLFTLYKNSLKNSSDLYTLTNKELQLIRLTLNVNNLSSNNNILIDKWIITWWSNSKYSISTSGQALLSANMQHSVVDTLTNSLALAVILILIVMLVIFKRLSLILYFIIPNIFPIIAALGIMGWAGINVDMGVAISASIILGIAVDDTIHFFNKYFSQLDSGKSAHYSIEYVMKYTGGAIIITTLSITLAFMMLFLSDFQPNIYFATTTVIALNIALLTDLLLLPAMFSLKEKRELKVKANKLTDINM